MTLPSNTTISMSQINSELGKGANAVISLNDSDVRTLLGKPSGQISMSDGWGKYVGPPVPPTFTYLICAGGGGGGMHFNSAVGGGGGGGGGVIERSSSTYMGTIVKGSSLTIVIGSGGQAATQSGIVATHATQGGNTTLSSSNGGSEYVVGGGCGASYLYNNGYLISPATAYGGSGGGGTITAKVEHFGTSDIWIWAGGYYIGQGYAGSNAYYYYSGSTITSAGAGAGGGGGGPGPDPQYFIHGAPGLSSSISGFADVYAPGGRARSQTNASNGGGGAVIGTKYGAGGGGGFNNSGYSNATNGRDGVVIISYPNTYALPISGLYSHNNVGGNHVLTFTSNTTITF